MNTERLTRLPPRRFHREESPAGAETLEMERGHESAGHYHAVQAGAGGLLTLAGRAYGLGAGAARLRRAQDINGHPLNRRFWRPPRNAFERKYFSAGIVELTPAFSCGSGQSRARQGAKRCYPNLWIPNPRSPQPSLRVPKYSLPEHSMDADLDWTAVGLPELGWLLAQCRQPRDPEVVPGDDDRTDIMDTLAAPHRWICKLFGIFLRASSYAPFQVSQASGILIDPQRLVTSAHALYHYDEDTGLFRVPDSIVVLPGLNPLDAIETPLGAFVVQRVAPGGQRNFHVPSEWITQESEAQPAREFDYGVVVLRDQRALRSGEPFDAWTEASPREAGVAAEEQPDAEALARLILASKLSGMRWVAAGYPGDRHCMPTRADNFEFASLALPVDSPHNVLVSRADFGRGMSGSPVWLNQPLRRKPGRPRKHRPLLIGLVEGGWGFESGTVVTHTTVITPRVLQRIRSPEFLSAL